MENKEIAIFSQNNNVAYSSIKANTQEEKIKLLNALDNCDFLLNDVAPIEFELKDVYINTYEKEIDGEIKLRYRTILFDKDGKSYVTTSSYFYFALAKIIAVLGTPDTWTSPLPIQVFKKQVKNGNKALALKIKEQ